MSFLAWPAAISIPGSTATVRAPRSTQRATPSPMTGRANSRKPHSTIRSGSCARNRPTMRRNSAVASGSRLPWPTNNTAGFMAVPSSELHALLRLDPRPVRVLDEFHFRHQVGQVDQLVAGVAPGDDHMQHLALTPQFVQHL